MKIALDVRKIAQRKTGDETYITNLVKNLGRLDHQNKYYLCTDSLEHEGRVQRLLDKLPPNFHFQTLSPAGKAFWTRKALPRFAKKEKIDLVHVQYITPQKLKKGIKLVTTIHDVSFKRFPQYLRFQDRFLLNRYIPRSIKRADKVIAVSEFTRQEILKLFPGTPADKVARVYNGVEEERFKEAGQHEPKYLERLKVKYDLGEKFVLHVSSLQPRKNVPALIEAFREYIRKYNDQKTNLVIGGEKGHNYDEEIETYFQDLGLKQRIRMIGYVRDDELPAIYAMAKLYVSPGFYEGFDLPLIEVMKSGVPVLASTGSCHEEVMGQAGMLADPGNTAEFAKKIDLGLNHQPTRNDLIMKGRKRATEFSWERSARETLDLYQGLQEKKGK